VLPPTDRLDVLIRLLGATAEEQRAFANARDRLEEWSRHRAPIVPRQLPSVTPRFVGRTAELSVLDALVSDSSDFVGAAKISTISGPAGAGKTALALYWAHRVAPLFPDGQLYADLRRSGRESGRAEPMTAIRGFLFALGADMSRIPSDMGTQAAFYRSVLAGRRMLVVLDGARSSAQVRPLLPGTSGSVAVVTSRKELPELTANGALLIDLKESEHQQLYRDRLHTAVYSRKIGCSALRRRRPSRCAK
jgi:hypothetical protein